MDVEICRGFQILRNKVGELRLVVQQKNEEGMLALVDLDQW